MWANGRTWALIPREEEPCVAHRRPLVAVAGVTDQRYCKGGGLGTRAEECTGPSGRRWGWTRWRQRSGEKWANSG